MGRTPGSSNPSPPAGRRRWAGVGRRPTAGCGDGGLRGSRRAPVATTLRLRSVGLLRGEGPLPREDGRAGGKGPRRGLEGSGPVLRAYGETGEEESEADCEAWLRRDTLGDNSGSRGDARVAATCVGLRGLEAPSPPLPCMGASWRSTRLASRSRRRAKEDRRCPLPTPLPLLAARLMSVILVDARSSRRDLGRTGRLAASWAARLFGEPPCAQSSAPELGVLLCGDSLNSSASSAATQLSRASPIGFFSSSSSLSTLGMRATRELPVAVPGERRCADMIDTRASKSFLSTHRSGGVAA